MNGTEALHIDTVQSRLMKTAVWLAVFLILRMLINNCVGMIIEPSYVMATNQMSTTKVSTAVAEFCKDAPFFGFMIRVGDFAMHYIYPILMVLALNWRGWKIAAWLPFVIGYAAAAAVYYSIGVQAIEGANIGLNGLPYYVLIPFIGTLLSFAIQLVVNYVTHKNWLYSYVKPCYDPKNPLPIEDGADEADENE